MNTTIPELSDEQIESMRFAIMSDVDKSNRTKARRYRRGAVGAFSLGVVVAIAGLGIGVIDRSGSAGNDSASSAGERDSSLKTTAPEAAQGDAGSDSAAKPTQLDTEREIVTTGSIGMTVANPPDAASKISKWVSSAGGRVDSRSETAAKGDDGGSVHLVVRIPQTKVDGSIDKFRTYGTVEHINIDDRDVTTEGKDLDARIKALRISVGRLEALMKGADSTTELLRAENALTQRQAELDSLVSQRTGLSDLVALSSLQIDLAAKDKADSVSPSGFWGGVVTGWNSLVAAIDGGVHALGVILPWGIALSLLAGIAWLVTHRRSSRVS